ncbi:MAG: 50S ribosomal protein L17 [Candidatus Dojkabacteria bacterium]
MYSNRKKFALQGKTAAHTKALVKSQIVELIRAGRIKTTPAKAKLVKKNFDKLVTKYKKGTAHSAKQVMSFFGENKRAFDRLEKVVKEHLSDRTSGYTRVIKTVPRVGDNAKQAYVMLVNYEVKDKLSQIQKLKQQRDKTVSKKTKSGSKKEDKK